MLWMRTPEKVYFKKGCLPVALDELKNVMGKKRFEQRDQNGHETSPPFFFDER